MIASMTVLGYVAQSAKEMARGKTPRDPSLAATWQSSLLQGGGMGIYGDFIMGDFSRFGRTPVETLAGREPTKSEFGNFGFDVWTFEAQSDGTIHIVADSLVIDIIAEREDVVYGTWHRVN